MLVESFTWFSLRRRQTKPPGFRDTSGCNAGYLDWAEGKKEICKCYSMLYNNQINARALIGQSAVVYCAGKPTEKSRVFWIII